MSIIPQPVFPESIITTPAVEYRNACLAELDRMFNRGLGLHKCFAAPSYQFEYQFKLLTCREVLIQFSTPAQRSDLIEHYDQRYPTEQLFFVFADWLNWDGQVCLYERYGLSKPPAPTTGLVLRYPIPILAAACIVTELNYYWVASQIPEARLQELLNQAERFAWVNLERKGLPKEQFLAAVTPLKERFYAMAQSNPEYED